MKNAFRFVLPALLAAVALPALAAEDARGAKDHPLLTRYPDSHIVEYVKNYDSVQFATGTKGGEPERKAVEGDATVITYFHNNADKQPSALQVIRNYQNAIKGIGGQVAYERHLPGARCCTARPTGASTPCRRCPRS